MQFGEGRHPSWVPPFSFQGADDVGEVGRERALEARPRAVGVGESEARGVEEMPRQSRQGWTAVEGIAGERVADESEVRADLVHHARGDLDLEQRKAMSALEGRE